MVPHGPWLGIFGMEDLILLRGPYPPGGDRDPRLADVTRPLPSLPVRPGAIETPAARRPGPVFIHEAREHGI